jgi:hypothetical protein
VNKVSNRGAKNDKMSITEPIRENGENAKSWKGGRYYIFFREKLRLAGSDQITPFILNKGTVIN